jgi:transglutaminase-like putative cysteine protease
MRYQATHITRYGYSEPVAQSLSQAHITPRSFPGQRVVETHLEVQPHAAVFEQRVDYFGNIVTTFAVFQSHDHLSTTATSVVEVEPANFRQTAIAWEDARAMLAAQTGEECLEAYEFVFDSAFAGASHELAEYARAVFTPRRPLIEAAVELSGLIHKEFRYQPKSTSIDMPLVEVLRNRTGVCQDFAHVMIGALRSLHLAARYVSGYLRSNSNYQGAEASHAWVAVFIPGSGWLNLDPTNNVIPSDSHVTLAWGRDYGDVTPVKGITLGGGGQVVEVEVHVVACT